MNDNLRDALYYRYFQILYRKYLKENPGDHVTAFAAAIVESSRAEVKDPRALKTWTRKFSRVKRAA
jgi:hypothetical protein